MLQNAINAVFNQLHSSLVQLNNEQYARKCSSLSQASIGRHVRHVIELFQSLESGYAGGIVNYDRRKRDTRIETDKELALALLKKIGDSLNRQNKDLVLEWSYDEDVSGTLLINTNYTRELAYNLEHTIHHMALIRVGFNEVSSIRLPDNYGVASATIRHRQTTCVQ